MEIEVKTDILEILKSHFKDYRGDLFGRAYDEIEKQRERAEQAETELREALAAVRQADDTMNNWKIQKTMEIRVGMWRDEYADIIALAAQGENERLRHELAVERVKAIGPVKERGRGDPPADSPSPEPAGGMPRVEVFAGFTQKEIDAVWPGPCVICGSTNYALSMGGPTICPSCDCGDFGIERVKRLGRELASTREELQARMKALEEAGAIMLMANAANKQRAEQAETRLRTVEKIREAAHLAAQGEKEKQ